MLYGGQQEVEIFHDMILKNITVRDRSGFALSTGSVLQRKLQQGFHLLRNVSEPQLSSDDPASLNAVRDHTSQHPGPKYDDERGNEGVAVSVSFKSCVPVEHRRNGLWIRPGTRPAGWTDPPRWRQSR